MIKIGNLCQINERLNIEDFINKLVVMRNNLILNLIQLSTYWKKFGTTLLEMPIIQMKVYSHSILTLNWFNSV
jgi:hypothetical protein